MTGDSVAQQLARVREPERYCTFARIQAIVGDDLRYRNDARVLLASPGPICLGASNRW